jgi:hypothetical protein
MWNDKPDGYPIPARNPMGTGMNFYPWVRVQVQISTRSLFADGRVITLPDLNPTHCHPYPRPATIKGPLPLPIVPHTPPSFSSPPKCLHHHLRKVAAVVISSPVAPPLRHRSRLGKPSPGLTLPCSPSPTPPVSPRTWRAVCRPCTTTAPAPAPLRSTVDPGASSVHDPWIMSTDFSI